MKKTEMHNWFNTDRKLKIGIWGLGRGADFFETCKMLGIEFVAGCDYQERLRTKFLKEAPGAFVTADADEFLAQDFDAVVISTYFVNHADDAIRCLKAGKHVLSECTSFFTPAQGVRLVEEVEKSGLVYNLAENYPFTPVNRYLAQKWKEGLFGDLVYGEYEYVHDCRLYTYTYDSKTPIEPGWTVHHWRSWLNFHYYCTHSLGPVMAITNTRPVRITSLPCNVRMAGYITDDKQAGLGTTASSLISMSNGGLVRNLMAGSTNDTHIQRLWGTLGAAELNVGVPLALCLGASGDSPKLAVNPNLNDELTLMAAKTGHGGGDFWTLYYFARQILTGEKAFFDIYHASDVTLSGIFAYRSSLENGKPYDIPDFRKKIDRDACRNDNFQLKAYDVKNGLFPANADKKISSQFTSVMTLLISWATKHRAYLDWKSIESDIVGPEKLDGLFESLAEGCDTMREVYLNARKIADAYPGSDAAKALLSMLKVGDEEKVISSGYLQKLKKHLADIMKSKFSMVQASRILPAPEDISKVKKPLKKLSFLPVPRTAFYYDIRGFYGKEEDGLIYLKGIINVKRAGKADLCFGVDGPVKVWINGKTAACIPGATNPIIPSQYKASAIWKEGDNEVTFAMLTNNTSNNRTSGLCAAKKSAK